MGTRCPIQSRTPLLDQIPSYLWLEVVRLICTAVEAEDIKTSMGSKRPEQCRNRATTAKDTDGTDIEGR